MSKKVIYTITLTVFIVYYLIGEMLSSDLIRAVSYQNGEMTISFVGIFLFALTTWVLLFMIRKKF